MASSRISQLASIIHEETSKVDSYLAANSLPTPSFDVSCPPKLFLPTEIQAARDAVLEASDELTALMLGPVESLIPPSPSWVCLAAIQRFGLAKSFPPGSTSTFGEIARACSIPESDARRILRQAMTFYIFHEPIAAVVAHTAASKALAEIPPVEAFMGFISDEIFPALARLVEAMIKWLGSEETHHTGFALVYGTNVPMMEVASQDPRRAKQMGMAMSFLNSRAGKEVRYLAENFAWGSADEGLLVDVGGSNGSVAVELAECLPKMRFVVQDKPEVIKDVLVPEILQKRLQFMAHDFFEEQPVKGADIYLLRSILHDWPDKYAAKILSNLIPALKKGARVLVCDICLASPGELSPYRARESRAFDLYMKAIQNAKERDKADWAELFSSIDPRFGSLEVAIPSGSSFALISVTWNGEEIF